MSLVSAAPQEDRNYFSPNCFNSSIIFSFCSIVFLRLTSIARQVMTIIIPPTIITNSNAHHPFSLKPHFNSAFVKKYYANGLLTN